MDMSDVTMCEEFFAPASTDAIYRLVAEYQMNRKRIDELAGLVSGDLGGVVHYFIEGNAGEDRFQRALYVDRLFQTEKAIKALDAAYWSKALQMTDVMNVMPQARRDQWNKQLTAWKDSHYKPGVKPEDDLPPFDESIVRDSLLALLNMRTQFFAERVDGIFRGLSGEHVTNSPAAFGKRMIVGYVLTEYHSENYSKCGLINDLRCVIAKFMGRDEPGYGASASLIRQLKGHWGEWVVIDGGALKIRVYKKGTAHIEVHPDMAWRLNGVLAHLYPMAIPPEFRTKPKKKAKEFQMIQRPLPFSVIEILANTGQACRHEASGNWRQPYSRIEIKNALEFGFADKDKAAFPEAVAIIESIGAGLVGAAIGTAMAPGAGTAGGAAAGLIAQGGVKSLLGK
jgi:hypothetical protein